jgi:hypothetical protein
MDSTQELLDVNRIVRALNMDDDDEKYNILADYARASGAVYLSASGVWFAPKPDVEVGNNE